MKLVQFEIQGRPWALLPIEDYDELRDQIEDAADAEALRKAQARDDETFPASFVERLLLSGENRVRVWREYRGMSAAQLARRANVPNAQLSALENGSSEGSAQILRRVADALGTTIDSLVEGTSEPSG